MEKQLMHEIAHLQNKICAMATASPIGQPQVAYMAYAVLDTGHLLLNTSAHSRKVKNIASNAHVAFAIGWDVQKKNYQLEGDASVIVKEDIAYKTYTDVFYKQNPHLEAFRNLPDHVFIRVLPTWIRLNDFSVSPPMIREFQLH